MKTKSLLNLQVGRIEELLSAVEDEVLAARRIFKIVELVEHVTAHLAVKRNVVYPMVASPESSALVTSWEGSATVRRALVLLARASYHDELCRQRTRQLRAALVSHSAHDERLIDDLEGSLSVRQSEALGRDAERFHDACMAARRDQLRPPKSVAS